MSATEEGAALVRVRGLTVRYRRLEGGEPFAALTEIGFTIRSGEILGLVGPSGSGKSSIALALLGLLPHGANVSGAILWQGRDLLTDREHQMRLRGHALGYVPQDPMAALNPFLTIGAQVMDSLHRAMSRSGRRRLAIELLRAVDLEPPDAFVGRYPHQLSGGQCQRVAIACAIANGPALIVADEPTSALDTVTAQQVMELLMSLARKSRTAVLLITHDRGAVDRYCDHLLVLDRGLIREQTKTGRPVGCTANADPLAASGRPSKVRRKAWA